MAYHDRFYKVRVPTARKYWTMNSSERCAVMDKLVLKNRIEYSKMLLSIPGKERMRIESRIPKIRQMKSNESDSEALLKRFDDDMNKFFSYFNRLQPYLPSFQESNNNKQQAFQGKDVSQAEQYSNGESFEQLNNQFHNDNDFNEIKSSFDKLNQYDYHVYNVQQIIESNSNYESNNQNDYELDDMNEYLPYESYDFQKNYQTIEQDEICVKNNIYETLSNVDLQNKEKNISKQALSDWIEQMRQDLKNNVNAINDDYYSDYSTATISGSSYYSGSEYE